MEAPKFSEQTKARIAKNIEILKAQNIPYYAEMKNIPTELNTKLKDKEQIFKLLISKFLVATMSATFPQEVDLQFFDFIQRNMDIQYNLDNILSDEDREVLNKIRNNESINKDKLTWLYEECAIYLWVLGLWEFPNSNHECNTKAMNDMLFLRFLHKFSCLIYLNLKILFQRYINIHIKQRDYYCFHQQL